MRPRRPGPLRAPRAGGADPSRASPPETARRTSATRASRAGASLRAPGERSGFDARANPQRGENSSTTIVVHVLEPDDAAPHRDRHRLGAVAGPELLHDVLDVDLDRLL